MRTLERHNLTLRLSSNQSQYIFLGRGCAIWVHRRSSLTGAVLFHRFEASCVVKGHHSHVTPCKITRLSKHIYLMEDCDSMLLVTETRTSLSSTRITPHPGHVCQEGRQTHIESAAVPLLGVTTLVTAPE